MPEDLPAVAIGCWPRKNGWPTSEDVNLFLERTDGKLDARLAVLTGLRRWAEPASSQMLVTLAAIIVSIGAVVLAVSDAAISIHIAVLLAVAAYLVVAVLAISLALRMDTRRKMAHVWLRAFEDALLAEGAPAPAKQPWFPLRRR